jgi:hypothetical protein
MPAPQQRRLIFAHIDEPGYTNDLACYVKHGGYEVLKRAVTRPPAELIDEVKKSGLRGRGGAGFPCGVKWTLVDRKSGKPIYLVVNADESEPGTFKDRYIMHQDPHQLIEGIMISCWANNVKQAYIYIRGEMPIGARILEKAIQEARDANFVGKNILGTNYSCDIFVHRGAGAYICGEETGPVFPRGPRPLPVPDDREQRRDALPREAHRGHGRRQLRQDRHAQQHRHAHLLRQRPRAETRLLRIRDRQDHDGPAPQRGLRRPAARAHVQGRDPRCSVSAKSLS